MQARLLKIRIKLLCILVAAFLLIDQPRFNQEGSLGIDLGGNVATASENYPPTDGKMSGFVLLKQRELVSEKTFFDEKDNPRHFSDFKGQVLLVNFWATWCAPCIREMPHLDELQADLGSDDFAVLTISQDLKGIAKAKPFMRERLKLDNLPLFVDKRTSLGRDMGVRGLPVTFLIDRKGQVVGHYTGPADWASDDAKAMINAVVAE